MQVPRPLMPNGLFDDGGIWYKVLYRQLEQRERSWRIAGLEGLRMKDMLLRDKERREEILQVRKWEGISGVYLSETLHCEAQEEFAYVLILHGGKNPFCCRTSIFILFF